MAQTPEPTLISTSSAPSTNACSICEMQVGSSDTAIVRTDETPPSMRSLSASVAAFMRETSKA